jgi:phage terminase large subunit-like protein
MIEIRRSELQRIAISLDPAVTSGEDSDDTGLVVCARGPCQPSTCKLDRSICTGHGYVIADLTCHVAPREWARRAVSAYYQWCEYAATRVVGEVNNGGDMIGEAIHAIDPGVPFREVRATRGKQLRAEPASALHDQGRLHMLGIFPELEEQMTTWTLDAKWSPDRLDALVWALVDLGLIGAQGAAFMAAWAPEAERARETALLPRGPEGLPRFADAGEQAVLRAGCEHRFFEGVCVHCHGPASERE